MKLKKITLDLHQSFLYLALESGKLIFRASPTGEANEKAKLKLCLFSFCFFNLSFQCSRQQRSQNNCLNWEELFL